LPELKPSTCDRCGGEFSILRRICKSCGAGPHWEHGADQDRFAWNTPPGPRPSGGKGLWGGLGSGTDPQRDRRRLDPDSRYPRPALRESPRLTAIAEGFRDIDGSFFPATLIGREWGSESELRSMGGFSFGHLESPTDESTGRPKKLSPERLAAMINEYLTENLTFEEIGQRYRQSASAARHRLQQYANALRCTRALCGAILCDGGCSQKEAAVMVGTNPRTLRRYVKKWRLEANRGISREIMQDRTICRKPS
jgi:hypothetical protein